MRSENVIEFRNVTKSFGDHSILRGVSFGIPKGQTTAIIGHSGAGKSVILKHIVGLLKPDSGSVEVMGCDMAVAPQAEVYAIRKRMGMLFKWSPVRVHDGRRKRGLPPRPTSKGTVSQ